LNPLAAAIGRRLARFLAQPRHVHSTSPAPYLDRLQACLCPGDVLLVEGNSRVSTAVKYLTQSTWSHAALYVGPRPELARDGGEAPCFVEADTLQGVRAVGLSHFAGLHARVCRPASLSAEDAARVTAHALARYLMPMPPVPLRWRRRLLVMGSGDPNRAICSTLIALAFESVRYPILPVVERRSRGDPTCSDCVDEILHARHHSLFVPRDFEVSPYFTVIKPTLFGHFDHMDLRWHDAND
jgi:hypothetical protein